jgi:hypothetical protein
MLGLLPPQDEISKPLHPEPASGGRLKARPLKVGR